MTLDPATAVIFHNRKKDTLVLYILDESGDRCITKKLERGAFLLPVPAEGQKYVVLDASKVMISDNYFCRPATIRFAEPGAC